MDAETSTGRTTPVTNPTHTPEGSEVVRPAILLKESHYADDDTDEYWSRPPTGRKVKFLDDTKLLQTQGAGEEQELLGDGNEKLEMSYGSDYLSIVTEERVVEKVYYSRFNVELAVKKQPCCVVT
uniref:Uncharacterized protein n=1 Tax=Pinguiococcus pyrenoidosus TaxID=172671 RepID=A0A7R9U514_9STRA|mmetsp:Transcript_15248/g.57941  ORF Transcript_15248/g.57941 Transcript_15248/m.57941 type:complete len:125 (+) Transcript_15248:567-941(+)